MSISQPTVLLISGGWHTPQSYTKLNDALSSSGFEVLVPTLPSMNGNRPPSADLQSDTDFIRSYTQDLINTGREILVLMHSYGGQVGTNALSGLSFASRSKEGLSGGVLHLIYMAATAIVEGKCMVDTVREFGHEELLPMAFDFADDRSCTHRDPKLLLIGTDNAVTDKEDEYVKTLTKWNGNCMYQPLTTERAAWRDGPVTYIHTTGDMTVPMDYQNVFVKGMEEAGVKVQCVSVETGHCPNLTKPDEIAEIVKKIAKRQSVEREDGVEPAKKASTKDVEGAIQSLGDTEA
jgi:pimeloyl-ACP methyl ester carboxylesterase